MTTHLDAKGRTVLALDESLDVTHAAPLHQSLTALRGKDIIVDASKVIHLGAQCAQVLLAAKRAWSDNRKAMRITAPSAAFLEGLRLLGLTPLLPVEENLQ